MIPGVLHYRVLFALLNIQDITASALLTMMRNGVEAVTIIIGIAIGVAIPNIFIHRYIESNKQRTVKDLLDKRYKKIEETLKLFPHDAIQLFLKRIVWIAFFY